MTAYELFFDTQVGGGGRGANLSRRDGTIYEVRREQTGCGIGRILGGLYRSAIPLIKHGGKEVGKEAVRTGLNVLKDVAKRRIPLKTALKRRMKESGHNLKRKAEQKINQMLDNLPYKSTDSTQQPQLLPSTGTEQTQSANGEKPAKRLKTSSTKKNRKQKKNTKLKKSGKNSRTVTDIFKNNNI